MSAKMKRTPIIVAVVAAIVAAGLTYTLTRPNTPPAPAAQAAVSPDAVDARATIEPSVTNPAYAESPTTKIACAAFVAGQQNFVYCAPRTDWGNGWGVGEFGEAAPGNTIIPRPPSSPYAPMNYDRPYAVVNGDFHDAAVTGAITCSADYTRGITCKNADGHGFTVAAQSATSF